MMVVFYLSDTILLNIKYLKTMYVYTDEWRWQILMYSYYLAGQWSFVMNLYNPPSTPDNTVLHPIELFGSRLHKLSMSETIILPFSFFKAQGSISQNRDRKEAWFWNYYWYKALFLNRGNFKTNGFQIPEILEVSPHVLKWLRLKHQFKGCNSCPKMLRLYMYSSWLILWQALLYPSSECYFLKFELSRCWHFGGKGAKEEGV